MFLMLGRIAAALAVAAASFAAACSSSRTGASTPTAIPSYTHTPWPSPTGSPTATATISRTATLTLAFTTTPCGCWTPATNNLAANPGFEAGSTVGWTFAPGCGPTGCSAPAAAAATAGPADGFCGFGGSGGAFNAVACGSFAAMVFSGQGFNPCNYASGALTQSLVLTCCASVSLCYAFESMKLASSPCYGDDAHAVFQISAASGGCGSSVLWQDRVQPCVHSGVVPASNNRWYMPWRAVYVNVCGYAGCTITVLAEAVSRGPEGCFARLDHVVVSGAGCSPPGQ